jgi:ELWxxDGT repeat protein
VALSGTTLAQPAAGDETAGRAGAVGPVGMLADLAPGAASSTPAQLTAVGDELFFTTRHPDPSDTLWVSDGTETGTVSLGKFPAVLYAGYPTEGVGQLTSVGGSLFFVADDGAGEFGLWKSNGTRRGTTLVKRIEAQRESMGLWELTDVDGTLFFTADHGLYGRELWKSDGTAAGTALVKDINPGTEYSRGPTDLTAAADGSLFFTADDGVRGRELWTSDGTAAGTVLVKEIAPGTADDFGINQPQALTAVGDTMFFRAGDGVHGSELWKTDGTTAGTVQVKDINPGREASRPEELVDAGGTLLFRASDATHDRVLWRSDGTADGTTMVKDVRVDRNRYAPGLVESGGQVFFSADNGQLWRTDGTTAGTVLVKDLLSTAFYGGPHDLTDVGGVVFFTADNDGERWELWRSDGTPEGTVELREFSGDRVDQFGLTDRFAATGGSAFFAADDGVHGVEPWRANAVATPPSNAFTVPKKGKSNLKKGSLRLKLALPGPGKLTVGPARGRLVKTSSQQVSSAGTTKVVLTPTKKGLRKLKQKLRRAKNQATNPKRAVGKLAVATRFAYTPTGGDRAIRKRTYILKLK